MANPFKSPLGYIVAGAIACVVFFVLAEFTSLPDRFLHAWGEEIEEVKPQPSKLDLLKDDNLEDKKPTFDSSLVDSRLQKSWDGSTWIINASDAVIKLDMAEIREDDGRFNQLFSNYQVAAQSFRAADLEVLPSINLLDGKAKQFDDGLMAAVVLASAPGHASEQAWIPNILKRLLTKLPPDSDAQAWCFCALDLGGYLSAEALANPSVHAVEFRKHFLQSAEAKVISFYTWTPDLERVWRFYKFLQQPLRGESGRFDKPIRAALLADESLRRDYEQMLRLFNRLSNPSAEATLLNSGDYFLSPMQTYENAVAERILGGGSLPPNVELMQEFVKAIRSGKVDLKPRKGSGWYDYQIYALETFLLPEHGRKNQKLLLTKKYKQRMLEAFKALVTKRRETHALMAMTAKAAAPSFKPPGVFPRLRVEPNPTYYLRMARSYAFIETALPAFFSSAEWQSMVGLKEGGVRQKPLMEEVAWMKQFFYGLHLIACEDIGMKPTLLDGELTDLVVPRKLAGDYLAHWEQDADLAVDTRVSIPIAETRAGFRLWSTLGVKGVKLDASYARPPRGRPKGAPKDWMPNDFESPPPAPAPVENLNTSVTTNASEDTAVSVAPANLWEILKTADSHYVLIVDEFAEVASPVILNRKEFRSICDREKTKERIVAAIAHGAGK